MLCMLYTHQIEHETDAKLFPGDTYYKNKDGSITLVDSPTRSKPSIPCVLQLNKTYGKFNGRLLYKCTVANLHAFLVPYDIKNVGFSKLFVSLYAIIKFVSWDDKHPLGTLLNVIGPVDVLPNFYEYQLHCRGLTASLKHFQKEATKRIATIQYRPMEHRTDVFSIDPDNCADFDDAFSIKKLDNDIVKISVYISNVALTIDALQLWTLFTDRVSTIYLPDNKRPMMPTCLSDGLCSLKANDKRAAFYMDVTIANSTIVDVQFGNCIVTLYKNYRYEEPKLLADKNYQLLFDVIKPMFPKINDSHDVVSELMILMNCQCAQRIKRGIFRSTSKIELPEHVKHLYSEHSAQYTTTLARHESMELDAYLHITSPIRRLVDLLNMLQFQKELGLTDFSNDANIFYDRWTQKLGYINQQMKAIRRTQTECELLANFDDIADKEYDAFIIEPGRAFVPELHFTSKVITDNETQVKVKLYLFSDEEQYTRKIRLQIIQ